MNWIGPLARQHHQAAPHQTLTVGLVNNASDRALASTERQFLALLRPPPPGIDLRVRFFTCPTIRRAGLPRSSLGHPYAPIDELYDTCPDALVVTGMEPQAPTLPQEPIWRDLTRLADWAEDRSIPVLWSCLAAHAAVLHRDGIARTRLPEKLSGIFPCHVAAPQHRLMAGLPPSWSTPHSRHYDLNPDALVAGGYRILLHSPQAAATMFHKSGGMCLFIQGHPEYGADTLLREYRRDMRRFLAGERNDVPAPPRHCLPQATEAALDALRPDAARLRHASTTVLGTMEAVLRDQVPPNTWHAHAIRLYANWLNAIADRDHAGPNRTASAINAPGPIH